MNKKYLALAAASAFATVAATPAHATIFEYQMNNGSVLTIDNQALTGTVIGTNINASFTSADFATFTGEGGLTPRFTAVLDTLTGTRVIKGQVVEPNPLNKDTTHPQLLKGLGDGRVNLWAWWGDPIIGGDYVTTIVGRSVTEVPAPGMLGLMGLALAGLFYGRRRRTAKVTYSGAMPQAA